MQPNMPLIVWVALFATLGCHSVRAQSTSSKVDDEIVRRFNQYEQLRSAFDLSSRFCKLVLSRSEDGMPREMMAVYTTGVGRIVDITMVGEEYSARDISVAGLDVGGLHCQLADMQVADGNSRHLLLSLFGVGADSGQVVFTWDGTQLVNVTPTRRIGDLVETELSDSVSVNLYGDAIPTLVSGDATMSEPGEGTSCEVYRWLDGRYSRYTTCSLSGQVVTVHHGASPQKHYFNVADGEGGPFILQIGNGNTDGSKRVTNGSVTVNGVAVLHNGELTQYTSKLSIPLTSLHIGENTVNIAVEGSDGSIVHFVVENHSGEPENKQ